MEGGGQKASGKRVEERERERHREIEEGVDYKLQSGMYHICRLGWGGQGSWESENFTSLSRVCVYVCVCVCVCVRVCVWGPFPHPLTALLAHLSPLPLSPFPPPPPDSVLHDQHHIIYTARSKEGKDQFQLLSSFLTATFKKSETRGEIGRDNFQNWFPSKLLSFC